MKLFTTLILLSLIFSELRAQDTYVALITDPQVGVEENAEKLIEVVDDINNRDSISLVIAMGNLTANGKFDEFLWVQEILDGLNTEYFVVGGEKDYLLSEGKGNEISLIWGDDRFLHYVNGNVFIGLNTFKPVYNSKGYYNIEARLWLHQKMSEHLNGQIFLIRYHNYSQWITNWEVLLKAAPSNIAINLITLDEDKAGNFTTMPYISLGESFGAIDGWKYFLIKIENDTLSRIELSKTKNGISVKEESLNTQFRLPIRSSPINKLSDNKITLTKVWDKKIEKSIVSKPTLKRNSICLTSKYGSVIYTDNKGKSLWQFETNGTVYSSPLVEKDLVIVATNEGDIITINNNTGGLFQVIGIGETITSDIALVDIEYNGMKTKGIVFGTGEGNFYCYELYSLEMVWWNQSAKEMINSSVASTEGKVLFQDRKGTLYCLSSQNGVLLWKWGTKTKVYDPLFKSDLAADKNNIYFLDFDGDLHCLDLLLGTDKWHLRKIEGTGKISLKRMSSELILHSGKNKILTISTKNGKIKNKFSLSEETKKEIATDMLIFDDQIFAGFTNGSVYQLNKNRDFEKIFWQGNAPVVSLNDINNNLLVTDYDGNITLLNISK